MPELPEVETIARGLADHLTGAVVARVSIGRPDYVVRDGGDARDLVGRRVVAVRRHGKRLELVLAPEAVVQVHLGMSGNAGIAPDAAPLPPHTHFRLAFRDRDVELRVRDPRRFGGVRLRFGPERGSDRRNFRPLGPDALRLRLPAFRTVLARRRRVKALLLDQTAIAGLGNIYVDEALHAAGIHPDAVAAALPDDRVRALLAALRRILRGAIRAGGSTFRDHRGADGRPGTWQRRHRVYGRAGTPCRRCGTPVARAPVAGRTTHWCPGCQRCFTVSEGNQQTN